MEGRGSLRPSFLALQGIGCVSYFPVRNGLRVTRCCGRGRPAEAPPLDFGLSIGDRRSSGRRCAGGGGRDRIEGAVGVGAVGVSGAQAMLGGVGIAAMNGPAVMFCALVAIAVSTVSAVGNTPIPRIPDHRRPLRNRCGLAPGTTARPVPYFKAPVFTTIPGAYEEPSCPIASHSDRRGHGGDENRQSGGSYPVRMVVGE